MINSENATSEQRRQRLTIRTRRVLGKDGEESVGATAYCPIQEKSVAVAECEGCDRFHALHFDPVTRASSIVCYSHALATSPAEEATPRGLGGPPNPLAPIATIMTKDVLCVRPETALDEVRALLLDRGISGVPVVDADGKPLGVVSRSDVLRADRDGDDTQEFQRVAARPTPHDGLDLGAGFRVYAPGTLTAAAVMTPVVLALPENANIGQAAALMAFEGVHRLPVVSNDGRVVAILSSLDVMRWFGQHSGYLIPPGVARRRA